MLIPEREVWFDENTVRPSFVLMSMVGAQIDYVITKIDREGGCAVASRRKALEYRRRKFKKDYHKAGDIINVHILAVGKRPIMAEAFGWDITLSQRDVSYCMVPDMRELYRPGQTCKAVIKSLDEPDGLKISIKETEPHPFDGADMRHPVGSRRASKITGKYGGGIFCRLDDSIDCLCLYSPYQQDSDFLIGDEVIVVVTQFDYGKKLVYGKVVAKW